ncbi:hypothetical protein BDV95DRAFT_378084 [Massariosphaeria phaeospora]|uniref:Uncharacterized protein n=1 Tax=Massariosphaeria phaeospora TaxID=100035 RepID=A0A7C8IG01_9PLEO|nr:hypothetical protein BDV95DRAFT_378084 [Massariosphaeria phaeospora]
MWQCESSKYTLMYQTNVLDSLDLSTCLRGCGSRLRSLFNHPRKCRVFAGAKRNSCFSTRYVHFRTLAQRLSAACQKGVFGVSASISKQEGRRTPQNLYIATNKPGIKPQPQIARWRREAVSQPSHAQVSQTHVLGLAPGRGGDVVQCASNNSGALSAPWTCQSGSFLIPDVGRCRDV